MKAGGGRWDWYVEGAERDANVFAKGWFDADLMSSDELEKFWELCIKRQIEYGPLR